MIALFSHPTPAGEVRIASRAGKVVGLSFLDSWERTERHLLRRFPDEKHRDGAGQGEAERQLEAYLAGDLDALTGLAVDAGGTSFHAFGLRSERCLRGGQSRMGSLLAQREARPPSALSERHAARIRSGS